MCSLVTSSTRIGTAYGRAILALLILILPTATALLPAANAQEGTPAPAPVVRVEEDWQLVLNEPGESLTAPQFHTVMSPFDHLNVAYAQVSWNYRELPEFAAGGLQLQAWGPDFDLSHHALRVDSLSLDAETITWTQQLLTDGMRIRFRITNGESLSWSSFGGLWSFIDIPLALPNLNQYSPDVSAANSWITYGSNRVTSLKILQVRRYAADGTLLSVDDTPRVIYQMNDGL